MDETSHTKYNIIASVMFFLDSRYSFTKCRCEWQYEENETDFPNNKRGNQFRTEGIGEMFVK